jgi:hypothetical protein
MGRYDALTQLEEKKAPVKKPDTLPVVPGKKLFSPSLPEKPVKQVGQEKEEQQKKAAVPEPERVPVGERVGVPPPVPLIPKVKRVIKQRQPFDIYEDQFQRLKQIKEAEKDFVNGRGMSQMVREAIDNYLKDHGTLRK